MNPLPTLLGLFILTFIFLTHPSAQNRPEDQATSKNPPEQQVQPVGMKTNEVLLDVLIHDKKGKIVKDVRPEELELFEDGIKQPVSSFVFFDAASAANGKGAPVSESSTQINLVTLVFDHMDAQRFETSRQAAIMFLDTALRPNTMVRVMVIGKQLYLMQQFTNERNKIYKGIERALGTAEKSYAEISAQNVDELQQRAEQLPLETPLSTAIVAPLQLQAGSHPRTDAILTQLTLNTMQQSERLIREAGMPSPLFPLLSIARNHRTIAGRKMVFYLSNGLYLNSSGQNELLKNVVSDANRANLSFYAVNTRQLLAQTGNMSSRLETATVINATQRPESGTVGARDPFDSFQGRNAGGVAAFDPRSAYSAFDTNQRRAQLNKKSPLAELTESTGGAMIQNNLEISTLLKQAIAELGTYYAISYTPTKQELDGKFRQITVKLTRAGLKPITRSGYFAAPLTVRKPVVTFETPMLAVLNETIVPHDFDFRAATLHFDENKNEQHDVVLIELPIQAILPTVKPDQKLVPLNFAMMAVIKNAQGEIIQKYSEAYELEIPATDINTWREQSAYLVRHCWLSAGNYTLETVIHDQQANHFSALRQTFRVSPTASPLKTSDLYLVRQIDPVEIDTNENDNPLIIEKFKITPDIAHTYSAQATNEIPFQLKIYPDPASQTLPALRIELSLQGKVIAQTAPTLPAPGQDHAIAFAAGIPTKGLPAGAYRLLATVQQGAAQAQQETTFVLTNANASLAAATEEDGVRAITSALNAPSDRVSELALVSLTAAKPIEINPAELIADVIKTGSALHPRLAEFTYSLRKVRRSFDKKGRLRSEEFKDYEAYPVKGQHALVQMSTNGTKHSVDRIEIDRKQATEALIKNEAEKLNSDTDQNVPAPSGYWGAGIEGVVQGKHIYFSINPAHFFALCDFRNPRRVLLEGRESIVLDFQAKPTSNAAPEQSWVKNLQGSVWIDFNDKVLVRIEAVAHPENQSQTVSGQTSTVAPHFVYQQQRIGAGLWSPALIRLNSGGNASILRGLNFDAWFEFTNYQHFETQDSDLKLTPQGAGKSN